MKKIKLDLLIDVFFTIFFLLKIGFNNISYLEYLIFFILCILCLVEIFLKKKIILDKFNIWYFLFFLFSTLSLFWAIDIKFSVKMLINIFANFVFSFLLINHYYSKENINKLINIFIFVVLVSSLKIIILYPFHIDKYDTVAKYINDVTGVASNTVSQMICFGLIFSFYKTLIYLKNNQNAYKKILYVILCIFLFVILLISESRKSIFLAIFAMFLLVLFTIKNKKSLYKVILFGLILSFLLFTYLMFNDDLRFEIFNLIKALIGHDYLDESTNLRFYFINVGLDIFKKYPLSGVGINNFGVYLKEVVGFSAFRYAHNNYIEVLSGLGIFGFISYYSFMGYLLISFIKKILKKNLNNMLELSIILLIVILIGDLGIVSYSSCLYLLILYITYYIFKFEESKKITKHYKISKFDMELII